MPQKHSGVRHFLDTRVSQDKRNYEYARENIFTRTNGLTGYIIIHVTLWSGQNASVIPSNK